MRRRRTFAAALILALVAGVSVLLVRPWQEGSAAAPDTGETPAPTRTTDPTDKTASGGRPVPGPSLLGEVARLGPSTLASVPATTTKAVVVRGDGPASANTTIELYSLESGAWQQVAKWRGHIGANGWATDRREGDLRSPMGTYTLTDAGGRLANPGTKLPYYRSKRFVPTGSSVFGDSLAGSFDYVIAIDFNRKRGASPLDTAQPMGASRGGGIWLHVDHDGPTHGCVAVPREGMLQLLKSLKPADRPIVVMGDWATLAT